MIIAGLLAASTTQAAGSTARAMAGLRAVLLTGDGVALLAAARLRHSIVHPSVTVADPGTGHAGQSL